MYIVCTGAESRRRQRVTCRECCTQRRQATNSGHHWPATLSRPRTKRTVVLTSSSMRERRKEATPDRPRSLRDVLPCLINPAAVSRRTAPCSLGDPVSPSLRHCPTHPAIPREPTWTANQPPRLFCLSQARRGRGGSGAASPRQRQPATSAQRSTTAGGRCALAAASIECTTVHACSITAGKQPNCQRPAPVPSTSVQQQLKAWIGLRPVHVTVGSRATRHGRRSPLSLSDPSTITAVVSAGPVPGETTRQRGQAKAWTTLSTAPGLRQVPSHQ